MRISDCGFKHQSRERQRPVTLEPRITNHESRRSSVAEQSHFAASSTPQERKVGRCLNRRTMGTGVHAAIVAIFIGAANAVHLTLGEIRRDARTAQNRTTRNG